MPNDADNLSTLSLSELRERLEARGHKMSLSALSEFIKTGDIAQQLRVGGKGNRLEFLPDTLEVLLAFFPQYKAANGKLPQAASMLHSFLKQENTALVKADRAGSLVPLFSESREVELLREISETLKARQEPPEDRLLTYKQARAEFGLSQKRLGELPRIKDGRGYKIWRSDVLRKITEMRGKITE